MVEDNKMIDCSKGTEIEWPLTGFTFATRTNIAKRQLCNRDACLLLLAANGPTVKTSTLKTLLRAWRPLEGVYYGATKTLRPGRRELDFSYLFNHYYGHIGTNASGKKYVPWTGANYAGPCWWWRNTETMRGTCQISSAGYARLEELRVLMGRIHGEVLGAIDVCLGKRESEVVS